MSRLALGVVIAVILFANTVMAVGGIESPKECQLCGMDRTAFAYSRMVIEYADGTNSGVCSLNCAVAEMKKYRTRQVKSFKVADFGTQKLVDVREATWVIGGNKPGVMTSVPKWAFAAKEDARKFIRNNGGRQATFDEALDLTLKENKQPGADLH
jgi:nitrous oxide reductase accessory protein NosL